MPHSRSRSQDDVRPVGATLLETEDRRRGLRPYLLPAGVFLVGAAISTVMFIAHNVRSTERARLAFERRATEVVAGGLEMGLDLPLEVLRSLPALFEASVDVSREEFRAFTRGALERYPGIYALEWLPRVPAEERAAHEAAARRDGLTGFQFTEIGDEGAMVRADVRSYYLPIYYMEPPNPIALGFDVASEAERLEPALRAVEAGGTVASPRIHLVEDDPSVYSIAVFHPVYRRGTPTETPAGRQEPWRGVTAEVFRVAPMVERALRALDTDGLSLVLRDEDAPAEMRRLYESVPDSAGDGMAEGLSQTIRFPFADRTWSLSILASPSYAGADSASWVVLAAGLLLSALVAVGLGASRTIVRLRRQMRAALKLGQYTLTERVGQGAMGVVYKASHAMLRRPTAIKLLPPGEGGAARLWRASSARCR